MDSETYNQWNETKKHIHQNKSRIHFRQGEVWFASIGQNIGYEVYGKGEKFFRPVVVFRKINRNTLLAIPLTSKPKEDRFHCQITFKGNTNNAILSQVRVIDSKRLAYKSGNLKREDFEKLEEAFVRFYELTPPKRGGYARPEGEQRVNDATIADRALDVKQGSARRSIPFSVLMSIYKNDNPDQLAEAIASTLDQTLPPDQFVIVGDGSLPPDILAVVDRFSAQHECIHFVPLERNMGLGAALNEGLKHCIHELVARMDADDICLSDRFAKQVAFMQAHPEVAVSSGAIEEFDDETLEPIAVRNVPLEHSAIVRFARRRSPINHPAAIFRKEAVLSVGGYPPLRKAQDYALWSLMLTRGYKMANLPDMLLRMRTGRDLFVRRGWEQLKQEIADRKSVV